MPVVVPAVAGAVDGLSSRKLAVLEAYPLAVGRVELEPELFYSTYDHQLDRDRRLVNLDGRFHETELDFRATVGLGRRQEAGLLGGVRMTAFSSRHRGGPDESKTAMSPWGLGWKGLLVGGDEDSPALALELGLTFPPAEDETFVVGEVGLIYSQPLAGPWSLDFDASYYQSSVTEPDDPHRGVQSNLGVGVDLADRWTLAAELNGYWERTGRGDESWEISPCVGFAYQFSELFALTLAFKDTPPGWGRNTPASAGINAYFTFALDRSRSAPTI